MANDLVWTKRMLGAFIEQACLSEEETIVLNDWVKGKSIVNTSMNNHMSTSKVDRIRRRIRKKYDFIQTYTAELPVRNTRL